MCSLFSIDSTMDDSPQNVYAKNLPKYLGFPLWIPEPSNTLLENYRLDGLQIGDVGIVDSESRFDVLFNICKPSSHALHKRHDIPTFEPIVLNDEDIYVKSNAVLPDSVISSGVTRIFSASDASSRYVFSKKQLGRMNVLKECLLS